MRLMPYGEHAVLAEPAEPAHVLALRDALADVAGITDLVPAARTLLVVFDPRITTAARVGEAIAAANTAPRGAVDGPSIELHVRYDGADLASVADDLGLSSQEVISRHVGVTYTVAFCGFAPGFAYLSGLDPELRVGRLAEPRTLVPAGAVGIAGEFTGVYPRPSPGGWRLLGRTEAPLWDLARTPPALLTPGTTVRFVTA